MVVFVEVGLKLLMEVVGGLSTALLAHGDKVLAEDGAIAVDDDKGKRRGFLGIGVSVSMTIRGREDVAQSNLTAADLRLFNSRSDMRCSFSQIMALRFSRSHSAHFSR